MHELRFRTLRRPLPILLVAALLWGCGGDSTESPVPTEPPVPVASRVEVTLTVSELTYGETTTASATVYDQNGDVMPGASVSWSSSDRRVASVAGGSITATGVGATIITAAAGKVTGSAELAVLHVQHALTAESAQAPPYAIFRLRLPLGAPVPSGTIAGTLAPTQGDGSGGARDVALSRSDDTALALVVPDVDPGAYQLLVELDANNRGVLMLTVTEPVTVADPETTAGTLVTRLTQLFDALDATGDETVTSNTALARAALADFRSKWAAASAEEKSAIAQFLEANPEVMEALTAAAEASMLSASGLAAAGDPSTAKLIATAIATGGAAILLAEVTGTLVGTCTAAGLTPAALVACAPAAAAFGGTFAMTLRALDSAAEVLRRTIVGLKDLYVDWTSPAAGAPAGSAAVQTTADPAGDFYSGVARSFTVVHPHRTARPEDVSAASGTMREFLEVALRVHDFWSTLRSWYTRLAQQVSFGNATPSVRPSIFPTRAAEESLPVPAGELAVTSISNPAVSCTVGGAGTTATLTCSTEAQSDQAFTVTLTRQTEFGAASVDVSGTLRYATTLLRKISGDAQSAYPGDPLREPVRVRVTSAIDGTPVAGATVQWSVASGGGTVTAATTTTDENGYASTAWTLGAAEGQQTLEARAVVDGKPVGGSPVVFTATADRGAMLQLLRGAKQTGNANEPLGDSLVVRVADRMARPVAGLTVHWRVTRGDGRLSASRTTTGDDGQSAVQWTLGSDLEGTVEAAVYDAAGNHIEGSPAKFATVGFLPSGQVLWISTSIRTDGDFDLTFHRAGADGTGHEAYAVAPGTQGTKYFDWAPDGSAAVFTTDSDEAPYRYITVLDASGNLRRIQDGGHSFAWSDDGSTIAYRPSGMSSDSEEAGWPELWLMNANGSSRRINPSGYSEANSDYWEYPVAIGSTGRLAFFVDADPGSGTDLVLWIEGIGSVAPPNSGQASAMAWSPDGSTLAVSWDAGNGAGGLKLYRSGTSPVVLEGARQTGTPVWSPDGSRIAVDANLYDVASGAFTRLDPNSSKGYSTAHGWTKDGKSILIEGFGRLHWVAPDGSLLHQWSAPSELRKVKFVPAR